MSDLMVLPGYDSYTGLAEGSDLLAQEFLLSLLNYSQVRPYLPRTRAVPFARLLMRAENVPALSEVAMAFNLSLPIIRPLMLEKTPEYLSANLYDLRYTSTPGEISITIQVKTTTGSSYVTKTFNFESANG